MTESKPNVRFWVTNCESGAPPTEDRRAAAASDPEGACHRLTRNPRAAQSVPADIVAGAVRSARLRLKNGVFQKAASALEMATQRQISAKHCGEILLGRLIGEGCNLREVVSTWHDFTPFLD